MGELHLEVSCHRLKEEFNIEARHGAPRVVYRETIKEDGIYKGTFEKVIGEKEFFAEVVFKLEAVPKLEKGLQVDLDIKNRKSLPNAWVNSAEDTLNNGFKDRR